MQTFLYAALAGKQESSLEKDSRRRTCVAGLQLTYTILRAPHPLKNVRSTAPNPARAGSVRNQAQLGNSGGFIETIPLGCQA